MRIRSAVYAQLGMSCVKFLGGVCAVGGFCCAWKYERDRWRREVDESCAVFRTWSEKNRRLEAQLQNPALSVHERAFIQKEIQNNDDALLVYPCKS